MSGQKKQPHKSDWRQVKSLITGAGGFVGSNLSRRLANEGLDIVTTDINGRVDVACDLTDQAATHALFEKVRPHVVFHLAAKVGGIYANVTQKADFYLINTQINTNVIAEVQRRQIQHVFAMGAGCAYPKRLEDEVLREEHLFDGPPEVTNDSYAYTKRNLLVHLQTLAEHPSFRYLYFIPSNIYGPHDNFHPMHSHVVAGLISRFTQAQREQAPQFKVWGDGSARRDLLFVEDLVDAIIAACDNQTSAGLINIATGHLTAVNDLAATIARHIGYQGEIATDTSFPAGQKHRMFDTEKISNLGWKPQHSLDEGLSKTIAWYQNTIVEHVKSRQPA